MEEKKKIANVKCKHCGAAFRISVPAKGGLIKVKCPNCKGELGFKFNVSQPSEENPEAQPAQQPTQANSNPQTPTARQQSAQQPSPQHNSEPEEKTRHFLASDMLEGTGKVVQIRGFLKKNLSFPLHEGDNVIGRADFSKPSDIQIEGDNTISRQSVNIKVESNILGSSFMFTVMQSKNPVILNGKPLIPNDPRFLKYGDTFTLGCTQFRFEKEK